MKDVNERKRQEVVNPEDQAACGTRRSDDHGDNNNGTFQDRVARPAG